MANNMKDIDEEMEITHGFNKFDQNGDGLITIDDLKKMMESLGEQLTDFQLHDMMNEISPNTDGIINFSAFAKLVSSVPVLDEEELD